MRVGSAAVSDPPAASLPPQDYPWVQRPTSGMLLEGELLDLTDEPGRLHEAAADHFELATRTPVVAVGSNASPVVLREKFSRAGVPASLPWTAATATDLAVGHSAHISGPGYVPAAPWHRQDAISDVVLAWLSTAQVRALDATEPNYVRVRLGTDRYPLATASGHRLPEYHVYRSRWGLLAEGEPLPLLSQSALVRWLNERLPGDPLPTEAPRAAAVLAEESVREAFPVRARAAGLVTADGLLPSS